MTSSSPVTLSANDGNLLDASGNPIAIGTPFTYNNATGNYELVVYTEELISATINVTNNVGSSAPFIVGSLSNFNTIISDFRDLLFMQIGNTLKEIDLNISCS